MHLVIVSLKESHLFKGCTVCPVWISTFIIYLTPPKDEHLDTSSAVNILVPALCVTQVVALLNFMVV